MQSCWLKARSPSELLMTEGLAFRPLGTQAAHAVAARPSALWSTPWEHSSARHGTRFTCDVIKCCPSAHTEPLREQAAAEGIASRNLHVGREGTMNYSPHLASGLGFPNRGKHSSGPPRGFTRSSCFNGKQWPHCPFSGTCNDFAMGVRSGLWFPRCMICSGRSK